MAGRAWTRRDFFRTSAVVAGLAAAPGLVTACARVDASATTTLDQIKERGHIKIGFAGEKPYAYRDGGELTGEDPTVHREIWTALGIEEIQETQLEFGQLIPGLNAHRFDVVAAGMFILPERCAQAAFSEPVYCAPQGFMVPTGNPDGITDYESVIAAGITMAVLPGAVEGIQARELGVPDGQITEVSSQRDGLAALEAGRARAFALTTISLNDVLKDNPDADFELTDAFVPVIDGVEQIGCGGAVFRLQDTEIREAFNAELAKLKDSGRLTELVEPFGFGPETLPSDEMTTEALCQG